VKDKFRQIADALYAAMKAGNGDVRLLAVAVDGATELDLDRAHCAVAFQYRNGINGYAAEDARDLLADAVMLCAANNQYDHISDEAEQRANRAEWHAEYIRATATGSHTEGEQSMKTSTEFNLNTYPRANGDMTIILDAQGGGLDYDIEYHWFRDADTYVRCFSSFTDVPFYSEADGEWAEKGFRQLVGLFIGEGC
jgi:hypothetical protein